MESCHHCSTPLKSHQENFCCRGCESVYQIIHDAGHEMFYDLKADTPLTPLRERPFQEREWQWLENLTESNNSTETTTLGIHGLTCVACVWLVEAVAKKLTGIYSVSLSITKGSIEIDYDPEKLDATELANTLYKLGYELSPKPNKNRSGKDSSLGIQLGICGALAMNTMAFTLPRYTGMKTSDELHELLTIIIIATSTLTFFIGGSYFFKRAWTALKMRQIHMDLPISIGLILAFVGSFIGWLSSHEELFYFDFVAIFTFLMLLGKHVQNTSLSKANAKFGSESTIPESYQNTAGEDITTQEINSGEHLLIPAGTVVPTASRLISEVTECSLAWITGEPATLVYKKSDPLPAGAVNQSQDTIEVETVEAVDPKHFFHQLPDQRQSLAPTLAKFIRYYLVAILIIGLAAGISWLSLSGDWVKATQVMISVYVVSCPCGIGLALPLLDTRFNKLANHIGVFPLTATCWTGFQKLKRVVFDKTGTLTLDRPALENPDHLETLTIEQKQILFTLTKQSLHPLSRSLFSTLIQQGITHSAHDQKATETPGVGISIQIESDTYALTRPPADSKNLACSFTLNDNLITTFQFTESARENVREALELIEQIMPHPTMILSGDVETSVTHLAKKLGIKEYAAQLTPEQKLSTIKNLQLTGDVLYIGDGINDIPAMREARLSAAPFANLNLVTKDVDLLFTDETLEFIPLLFHLSESRNKLNKQLLIYTILYNVIVVAIATSGIMSPFVAAIIMPLSSLISLYLVSRKIQHSQH